MKCDFLIGKYIAHRGIHDKYLENSLKSIEEAIHHHFIIEFDVRLTKDKKVIVFHDDNLKRLFNIDRRISDMSYEEVKKYQYIPTLKEVLALVAGREPMIIELKGSRYDYLLPRLVSQELDHYKGEFVVASFNPLTILWFRLNRPKYKRGYFLYTSRNITKHLLKSKLFTSLINPCFIGTNVKLELFSKLKSRYQGKYTLIGYTIDNYSMYLKYQSLFDNLIIDFNQELILKLKKQRDHIVASQKE